VADVVVTACKSEEEYEPTQVEDFLSQRRESQAAGLASSVELKSTQPPMSPASLRQALTQTADFPIGLSCVEWQVIDNVLEVQVVNFSSGCGVEWQGRATREGDRLTLLLDNPRCAVAACGTCLYDTATVIELPSIGDIRLEMSTDPTCTGERDIQEWRLPLAAQPQGMICEYARAPGLGSLSGPAFTRCSVDDRSCDDGLTCVDDDARGHCLPTCSTDADCPLPGGTRCSAGHCVPSTSIP
jgi:hypothetical protein